MLVSINFLEHLLGDSSYTYIKYHCNFSLACSSLDSSLPRDKFKEEIWGWLFHGKVWISSQVHKQTHKLHSYLVPKEQRKIIWLQPTSTSRPKSCTSRMKSFDEKPSPPSRKSPSVWQSLAGLSPRALIAASIVSTAMDRYVVHFPPAIVTSPLLLTRIRWLRAIEAVLLEFGSITNGRIPLQAAKTSPRRTVRECVINLYIQWKRIYVQ